MKQLTPIQWLKYIYETTGNLKESDFDYAYNWTEQNRFTEEQVREAIEVTIRKTRVFYDYEIDEIIQSLKQPKKD